MKTRTRATRRRTRWLIILAILIPSYYLSGRFRIQAHYDTQSSQQFSANLESAALTFGWLSNRARHGLAPSKLPNFYWSRTWYGFSANTAWRPYHAGALPFPQKSDAHQFVFPLWPIPMLTLGYLLYLHGLVRGEGLAKSGRCQSCGYDLTGAPPQSGTPTCPECGTRPELEEPT